MMILKSIFLSLPLLGVTVINAMKPISIYEAAKQGDIATIEHLLSIDVSLLNKQDECKQTPLDYAATYGQIAVIDLLLDKYKAQVDQEDFVGRTALYHAVFAGNKAITRTLLEHHANVNHCDRDDKTPLHYAAMKGRKKIVNLLLQHGAWINPQDNLHCIPLHYAAEAGNKAIIRILLNQGAPINCQDQYGATPLYYAVNNRHERVIHFLHKKGATITHPDCTDYHKNDLGLMFNFNFSPLHCAVHYKNNTMIRSLLILGADMHKKNYFNQSPFEIAAEEQQQHMRTLLQQIARLRISQLAVCCGQHAQAGQKSNIRFVPQGCIKAICSYLQPEDFPTDFKKTNIRTNCTFL